MTDLEATICDLLSSRRTALLSDLAAHVAIPTGTGHAEGIDQYRQVLLSRLARLDTTITRHPGDPRPDWLDPDPARPAGAIPETVTCSHHPLPGAPRILLAGHLDTVHDPFGSFQKLEVQVDGKRAIGPGCTDMKGGNLIALHALEALHEAGVRLNWTFLLNADEETGSYHSARALREQAAGHDFGLAMEPALPAPTPLPPGLSHPHNVCSLASQRMGSGHFRFDVRGRSAHVGRDFTQGVSAVTALADIITKIGGMAEPDRGLIFNIGPLKGGSAVNIVPDSASCWGNVRFAQSLDADRAVSSLEALTTPADAPLDALPRVSLRRVWSRPVKPLIPAVERMIDVVQQAGAELGQTILPAATGGVCDGNILQDAGLPTIDTLGVRGGGTHTSQEWIEIASLVERAQLLAIVIIRLTQ